MLGFLATIFIGTLLMLLLEPWKPWVVRDTAPDAGFCLACRSVQSSNGDDPSGLTCGRCGATELVELCSDLAQSYFAELYL